MVDPEPRGPRRVLLPTSHSDLRATWHAEADVVVLTLWRGDRCTGSAPLDARQAAELLTFLATALADRPTRQADAPPTSPDTVPAPSTADGLAPPTSDTG